jgi:hypothetical protein
MKRRLFPRPKSEPPILEAVTQDGRTFFRLRYSNRQFGYILPTNKTVTPADLSAALGVFKRTIEREFGLGKE